MSDSVSPSGGADVAGFVASLDQKFADASAMSEASMGFQANMKMLEAEESANNALMTTWQSFNQHVAQS